MRELGDGPQQYRTYLTNLNISLRLRCPRSRVCFCPHRPLVSSPSVENQAKRFARVVIPSPLKQPLIYAVPPDLQDEILVGMRALIPLGRRKVVGIVFELLPETHLIETKQILAVLDEQPILDAALIQLSLWIAQYYLATIGEVLATILPPSLRSESQRTVVAPPPTLFSRHDGAPPPRPLLCATHSRI